MLGQQKSRPIAWLGPLEEARVYGINFTPLAYKEPHHSTVNGINLEGIGFAFFLFMIPHDPAQYVEVVLIGHDLDVNGLTLAPAGLLQVGRVNGLAATPWISFIHQVNGVNIALFISMSYRQQGLNVAAVNTTVESNGVQLGFVNVAKRIKGVQLGLLNQGDQGKGLQIGLWNVNGKRKRLFFNWVKTNK